MITAEYWFSIILISFTIAVVIQVKNRDKMRKFQAKLDEIEKRGK